MSVIVTSTTNTADEVEAAATANGEVLEESNAPAVAAEDVHEEGGTHLVTKGPDKGCGSFDATRDWEEKRGIRIASTSDSQAAVDKEQEKADEKVAERTQEYLDGPEMGKTRRKLLHKVSRLHVEVSDRDAKIQERDTKIGELEQQLAARDTSQQPQNGQQSTQEQLRQAEYQYRQQVTQPLQRELAAERAKTAALKYPDWDEVTKGVTMPTEILEKRLLPWDCGFDVAYYLGQHPEEAKQISDAYNRGDYNGVDAQLMEIGIDVKRHPPSSQRRQGARTRPEPIEPVRGGAATSSVPLDRADFQTFKRIREEQERSRRR